MSGKWPTAVIYARMFWWLYIWAVVAFMSIAGLRHDAQFFEVDFTGFFFVNGIACLVYIFFTGIVPPFWWLVMLPWRLRSRPLAALGVVAAVALWLALVIVVIPRYYGPSWQQVSVSLSVIAVIALYRLVRYRRRKRAHVVEGAPN